MWTLTPAVVGTLSMFIAATTQEVKGPRKIILIRKVAGTLRRAVCCSARRFVRNELTA